MNGLIPIISLVGSICSIVAVYLTLDKRYHEKIEKKEAESKQFLAFLQKEHETLEKRKAVESEKKDFWPTTEEAVSQFKIPAKRSSNRGLYRKIRISFRKISNYWTSSEEEIAKRKSLKKKDTEQMDAALETMPQWSRKQVCGTYEVKGQNPKKQSYSGELQIKERDEVFLGTWKFPTREIGASPQSDEGTGLLVGNMLMFNFKHTDSQDPYTGVVSYQIISDGVMRGLWTAFGKSNVGFEECRKKKPDE